MPKPVVAVGFRGMNNLETSPAMLLDDAKRITPKIALNCEVLDGGKLVKRQGYSLEISLPGAHSLWANSIMLAAANGILYRIGNEATPLATIDGPKSPVTYQELGSTIYMATDTWTAIYKLLSGSITTWGLALPPAPALSIVAGEMPPGTYSVAYTRSDGDRLSGNGPISQISWQGGAQGIMLGNLPSDGQAWITQPNEDKLFLATVVNGVIVGQAPKNIPLPSFQMAPPPGMTHFAQAFGRIWGCVGKNLIFSPPFKYEWFHPKDFKPFLEDIVMVAPVNDGLFVNSADSTWFLDGTDPAKMILKRIGDGAVRGTLVYAELPGAVVGGGYEMSRRLSQLPSPVWVGKHGFVVGTQTGHLVHLTESRLRMSIRTQGSSVFRVKKGVPQIISVLHGPLSSEDPKTETAIFSSGNLFD